MGKLKSLGSFSGKVGEIVGVEINNKSYIRKKPVRTAPRTPGEMKQLTIFGMVQKWINPIHLFLRLGYRGAIEDMHPLNAAKSIIHKEAVSREGDPRVVPEQVRVSTGSLALPAGMEVMLVDGTDLVFIWEPVISIKSSPRDRIMMLAYNPETGSSFMDTSGPKRQDGHATLVLDSTASGLYHVYAAFISEDHSRQSESVYLGSKNV